MTIGAKGVKAQPLPWISVQSCLPRDNPKQHYAVCYRTDPHPLSTKRPRRCVCTAVYSGGTWRFVSPRDKTRVSDRVTHWLRVTLPRRCPTCKGSTWVTTSYRNGPDFEVSCPDCSDGLADL